MVESKEIKLEVLEAPRQPLILLIGITSMEIKDANKELIENISKYVEEFGYYSFHPEHVEQLVQKFTKIICEENVDLDFCKNDLLCFILQEILRSLVRKEERTLSNLESTRKEEELSKLCPPLSFSVDREFLESKNREESYNNLSRIYGEDEIKLFTTKFEEAPWEEKLELKSRMKLEKLFKKPRIASYNTSNNRTAIVLLDNRYRYIGHIYAWPSAGTPIIKALEVQGIRTSLQNLHCKPKLRNAAFYLFYGILQVAKRYDMDLIQVLNPYAVMAKILREKLRAPFSDRWYISTEGLEDTFDRLIKRNEFIPTKVVDLLEHSCEHPFLSEVDILFHQEPEDIETMIKEDIKTMKLTKKNLTREDIKLWWTDLIFREPYADWHPSWYDYYRFLDRRKGHNEILSQLKHLEKSRI